MRDDAAFALSHRCLLHLMGKGFRNGSWRRLKQVERALYMASISLAKIRGRIVNRKLILQLGCIVDKIADTAGCGLANAHRRAADLYGRFEAIGLFGWAPAVRSWFDDPRYVLWLGGSFFVGR